MASTCHGRNRRAARRTLPPGRRGHPRTHRAQPAGRTPRSGRIAAARGRARNARRDRLGRRARLPARRQQWRNAESGRQFVRFTFAGVPLRHDPSRALDAGIVRALWMTSRRDRGGVGAPAQPDGSRAASTTGSPGIACRSMRSAGCRPRRRRPERDGAGHGHRRHVGRCRFVGRGAAAAARRRADRRHVHAELGRR